MRSTSLHPSTDPRALDPLNIPDNDDRLILLPFDAADACEPALARRPSPADTPCPVVVQSLLPGPPHHRDPPVAPFQLGPLATAWSRPGYTDAARAALELIAAGDCYQVNLAHHLTAPFRGCALSLHRALAAEARPDFGAFLCWDDPQPPTADHPPRRHAVVSLSPELFLSYDPATRLIVTRPMKGTRPIDADPAELRDAPKDRAELDMIVDLMRNDLGRIAAPGSVRVTRPRDIHAHARSVWQATATVEARLRDDRTPADLARALFPAGSVTGAPKIRAVQILRRLEPRPRGPYCGSLIHATPDGRLTASVLIRTATIVGTPDPAGPHAFLDARLDFPVGAGIVADSDPEAEWLETLTKARALTDRLCVTRAQQFDPAPNGHGLP